MVNIICICLTGDRESERVDRWSGGVGSPVSSRRCKGFHKIAHHVHLGVLRCLSLAPDRWVIEQVEIIGHELTDNVH